MRGSRRYDRARFVVTQGEDQMERGLTQGAKLLAVVAVLAATGCLEKPDPWNPMDASQDGVAEVDARVGDSAGEASEAPRIELPDVAGEGPGQEIRDLVEHEGDGPQNADGEVLDCCQAEALDIEVDVLIDVEMDGPVDVKVEAAVVSGSLSVTSVPPVVCGGESKGGGWTLQPRGRAGSPAKNSSKGGGWTLAGTVSGGME
jgi:hypothetical protein